MAKETKPMAEIKGVEVPIKFNIPENIINRFANNMVVQFLENEFRLLFFEVNPEVYIGKKPKMPDEVQANCVSSIIVSIDKMPTFIELLQRQYTLYKGIKESSKEVNILKP